MNSTLYNPDGEIWHKSNPDDGWSIVKEKEGGWTAMVYYLFLGPNAEELGYRHWFDSLQEAEETVALWLLKRT